MIGRETIMPAPRKCPDELRGRSVRLVAEDGEHGAITRVAVRLDVNPRRCATGSSANATRGSLASVGL
jgi:hypothetical protein